MSLGALATAFLLPPVNLALAGVAGWVLARRYRRAGQVLRNTALVLIVLLAMPITARLMLAPLEACLQTTPSPQAPPAAIVVLSANSTVNRPNDLGLPRTDIGDLTLQRLRAGAALQRRTGLPLLVTGGRLARDEPPIAVLMARSLQADFGVETRWIEPESEDTWENARRSAAMLRAEGVGSVYLVTHPWHMKRAALAFAHFGIAVTAAPTALDPGPDGTFDQFVPAVYGWVLNYYAIHEWIGLAVYTLRARAG